MRVIKTTSAVKNLQQLAQDADLALLQVPLITESFLLCSCRVPFICKDVPLNQGDLTDGQPEVNTQPTARGWGKELHATGAA